jgi:hypothetical protein
VEATGGKPGAVYELISPDLTLHAPGPYIVTFWYHVYGTQPGTLSAFEWTGTTKNGPLWTADKAATSLST